MKLLLPLVLLSLLLTAPRPRFETTGFGRAMTESAVTFVSKAAAAAGVGEKLGLSRSVHAVSGIRQVTKEKMVLNDYTPTVEVDPETYEVRADGELLTCEPAEVLPMAQRYFLF